jgi:hypothetical protein
VRDGGDCIRGADVGRWRGRRLGGGRDPVVAPRVGAVSVVSRGCQGPNAEAEQAVDGRYVYEVWIGCGPQGGIGFARSVDDGRHFSRPMRVPGSVPPGHAYDLPAEGWDPAITVAPDGTIYVSYMVARRYAHPMVAMSVDHGVRFARVVPLMPPARYRHNWGDRDFIAVAPNGTIYLTWTYGSVYHPSGVTYTNPVIQKSTDRGRTWSRLKPISPGVGVNITAAAPLLVEPSGQIDVLLWVNGSIRNHHYVHSPEDDYFTSSVDGGSRWSRPVRLGPPGFRIDPRVVTWIDADIGIDATGVLYATWDPAPRRRRGLVVLFAQSRPDLVCSPSGHAIARWRRAHHGGRRRPSGHRLRRLGDERPTPGMGAIPSAVLGPHRMAVDADPDINHVWLSNALARRHDRVNRAARLPGRAPPTSDGQLGRANTNQYTDLGSSGPDEIANSTRRWARLQQVVNNLVSMGVTRNGGV